MDRAFRVIIGARWREAALGGVIAVALFVGFVLVADRPSLRALIVIAYLGLGPGAAVVWLARIDDRAMQVALIVPLSIAVDALVVTGLLYAGIWSPNLAFAMVAAITLVAVVLGVRERTAVVPLVALTLLPPIVLLLGQL